MPEIGALQPCLTGLAPGVPSIVAACLAAALIPFVIWNVRHQHFPGKRALIVAHLGAMWWLGMAALELSVAGTECKLLARSLSQPGVALVATAWMCFVYRYTLGAAAGVNRAQNLLMVAATLTAGVVTLTNDTHGMFYTAAGLGDGAGFGPALVVSHGPLSYAALGYVAITVAISLVLLFKAATTAQDSGQQRYWLLFALCLAPVLGTLGHRVFDVAIWGHDPTPFTFAVVIVIYAAMLAGDSTLDLGALARRQAYSNLPQAIFVIGSANRLTVGNRAAEALLADFSDSLGGEGPAEAAVLTLFEAARGDERGRSAAQPLGNRNYDVEIQPIHRAVGRDPAPLGYIMIADDVTSSVRLQEELMRAAETAAADAERDPLTGLSNRRPLDQRFAELARAAAAQEEALQLVIVDVDRFKWINDTYGHEAGDAALVLISQALRGVFRKDDAVFRIGGEEFLVIASGMSQRALVVRLRFARARLAEELSRHATFRDAITFSAGIGEWPHDGATLESLMRIADRRLLRAKRAGRNRFFGTSTAQGMTEEGEDA